LLLLFAARSSAQRARVALRRRRALGLGRLDQLARHADAALDLSRVPREERLHGIGDRAELEARGLGAVVVPAMEALELAGRRHPDRERVLAAHAVLLEPRGRYPHQLGVVRRGVDA